MSRKRGDIAEDEAVAFLLQNGFRVVERNFTCRFGEIDIVAEKDGTLHFVEVKSGSGFEPVYNITKAKLSKLYRSIDRYLQKRGVQMPYQLDAMIIKKSSVELLENITL
ncbi:MAG: YraN family protein [Hydrogenimonas sp.]|nr:YraN family protein [Hydrogenimonas sp.]